MIYVLHSAWHIVIAAILYDHISLIITSNGSSSYKIRSKVKVPTIWYQGLSLSSLIFPR